MAKVTKDEVVVKPARYIAPEYGWSYHVDLSEEEALLVAGVLGRHRSSDACDTFPVYNQLVDALGYDVYQLRGPRVAGGTH